jgi:hypothetical protein
MNIRPSRELIAPGQCDHSPPQARFASPFLPRMFACPRFPRVPRLKPRNT